MGLKIACDGCGASVVGVTAGLKKVKGRYLCKNCQLNPTREVRYFCTSCNTHAAFGKLKGSTWISFVLYCFYLVPGIIYSIWRRSGNSLLCITCSRPTLVPATSAEQVKCPDCRELVLKDARKCKHCGCRLVPQ